MASKAKSYISIVLKLAVAAGLITYMISSGHLNLSTLWGLMTPFNVIVALMLTIGGTVLAAWRWILLLRTRGFEIPIGYGLSLYLIGIFFNHALPGAVGGDLVRGYYLVADHPERKVDSILSIAIDRVLGLYSFFILTLLAVAIDFKFVMGHEKIHWVALTCFLVFMGMTAFFTITFSKRLSSTLGIEYVGQKIVAVGTLIEAIHRFGQNRPMIALSVLVSLGAQIFTMIFFFLFAKVTGEVGVTWNAVLFAVPMGFVVTALPISPAGIGVGQVAFQFLFSVFLQRQTSFGANAITAFQLSIACMAVLGAICYLRRRKPHDLEKASHFTEATST